jgi:hypothetical protein
MKWVKASLILILVAGSVGSGVASADRGRFHHGHRSHFGVFIGAPWPWYHPPPWNYPPAYYYDDYYPRTVIVPSSPSQYIERSEEDSGSAPASGYWYYCRNPDGYYPYVKECPGGWQKVPPQPPPR